VPPIKVHSGLKSVDRQETYHLGHYEVSFADGPVRFQLHANICTEQDCPCDNILFSWLTVGTTFHTWYSSERDWRDEQGRPLGEELAHVFAIVEDTETFRERYRHLVFLRRCQVLAEIGRLHGPFEILLPGDLLEDDRARGISGRVTVTIDGEASAHRFVLELCGDPACYCRDIFLVLPELPGPPAFLIGDDDCWLPAEDDADTALMEQVRDALAATPRFAGLVAALRSERRLQNYHRFVTAYPANTGLSV
jgi:hypothetical protein